MWNSFQSCSNNCFNQIRKNSTPYKIRVCSLSSHFFCHWNFITLWWTIDKSLLYHVQSPNTVTNKKKCFSSESQIQPNWFSDSFRTISSHINRTRTYYRLNFYKKKKKIAHQSVDRCLYRIISTNFWFDSFLSVIFFISEMRMT